jgi:hypothetical protein
VEHGHHRLDGFYPAIAGKEGVECAVQRVISPRGGGAEADSLTYGVNASVGSAGRMGYRPVPKDTIEYPLELRLYRAARWLALPPDKAGAVVV